MFDLLKRVIYKALKTMQDIHIEVHHATITDSTRFQGRHVLVTGGSKGIGLSIAGKLVAGGATVVITGRNEENLRQAVAKLGKERAAAIAFDAARIDGATLLQEAESKFGVIDTLVSNAGISLHEPSYFDVTEQTFDQQLAINLKGPYFLCQAFIQYYRSHHLKNGHILLMASETAGQPSYRPYSITKTATVFFMKWLAQNFIAEGIRVNAVAPGVTGTDMTHRNGSGAAVSPGAPGKRILAPEEIGEVCAFLLSDAASSIAGQVIACNEATCCFNNTVALDGCSVGEGRC